MKCEGWLVVVWDGYWWDESHRFQCKLKSSHPNPTTYKIWSYSTKMPPSLAWDWQEMSYQYHEDRMRQDPLLVSKRYKAGNIRWAPFLGFVGKVLTGCIITICHCHMSTCRLWGYCIKSLWSNTTARYISHQANQHLFLRFLALSSKCSDDPSPIISQVPISNVVNEASHRFAMEQFLASANPVDVDLWQPTSQLLHCCPQIKGSLLPRYQNWASKVEVITTSVRLRKINIEEEG